MAEHVIRVHDVIPLKAIVTRAAARRLAGQLAEVTKGTDVVVLDFAGVDAVTPSFVDELIGVLTEASVIGVPDSSVQFWNAPTRLSEKYRAIGRGRGIDVREIDGNRWVIEPRS